MKLNPRGYTKEAASNLFKMKPEAALDYFGGKEIITDWQNIAKDAHSRAFTVAGETREAVLQDLYTALQDALKNGSTMDMFRNDAMDRLQKSGWLRGVVAYGDDGKAVYESTASTTYDRLERIFRTNASSAHAAARYESIMQSGLEFVEYVTAEDERVREEHRLLADKVFHISDPFLQYFSPPNGYNCRCSLQGRSEQWVQRNGYNIDEIRARAGENRIQERNIIDPDGSVRTYHVYDLGNGKVFAADKGWDYNPALSFYQMRAVRPESGGIVPLAASTSARAMLQKLGADARGILTVTDPAGRQVIFTASSFVKSDLKLAALIPAIIAAPDKYISKPDEAVTIYGKKAADGKYYTVVLSGYNVNQTISLYRAKDFKEDFTK